MKADGRNVHIVTGSVRLQQTDAAAAAAQVGSPELFPAVPFMLSGPDIFTKHVRTDFQRGKILGDAVMQFI